MTNTEKRIAIAVVLKKRFPNLTAAETIEIIEQIMEIVQ